MQCITRNLIILLALAMVILSGTSCWRMGLGSMSGGSDKDSETDADMALDADRELDADADVDQDGDTDVFVDADSDTDTSTGPLYPLNGLIAHYPMDGNADDSSDFENHGVVHGPTLTTDRDGRADSAYFFDGVDDYIDIGNDRSLEIDPPLTFAVWVNVQTLGTVIFTNNFEENQHCGLNLLTKAIDGYRGEVMISLGSGGGTLPNNRRSKIGTTILEIGAWYHIVGVVRDFDDMDIFINGENDGGELIGNGPESVFYTDGPASIGREDISSMNSPYFFSGSMDDIFFYERALSPEEVSLLFELE